jgi:hypothetical protein
MLAIGAAILEIWSGFDVLFADLFFFAQDVMVQDIVSLQSVEMR